MTLGFSPEIQLHQKAVMDSLQDAPARVEALCGLSRFRAGLHACFTRRGDALFELADAMLCAQGPVRSPVELSLEPESAAGMALFTMPWPRAGSAVAGCGACWPACRLRPGRVSR